LARLLPLLRRRNTTHRLISSGQSLLRKPIAPLLRKPLAPSELKLKTPGLKAKNLKRKKFALYVGGGLSMGVVSILIQGLMVKAND
jgi:hypothetical protein